MKVFLYQTGRQYSEHGQRLIITFEAPIAFFVDLDRKMSGYVWIVGSDEVEATCYQVARDVLNTYDSTGWLHHSIMMSEHPDRFSTLTREQVQALEVRAKALIENEDVLFKFSRLADGQAMTHSEGVAVAPKLLILHITVAQPDDSGPVYRAVDHESGRVVTVATTQEEVAMILNLDPFTEAATRAAKLFYPRARLLGYADDNYQGGKLFVATME